MVKNSQLYSQIIFMYTYIKSKVCNTYNLRFFKWIHKFEVVLSIKIIGRNWKTSTNINSLKIKT